MTTTMANNGSWLSAHGKLWYDDPWYRIAWIVWPQAIGLLLFVVLWLSPPGPGFIPWAKPIPEPQKAPIPAPVAPTPGLEAGPRPKTAQPVDALAPCKTGDPQQIIAACSALLGSGNLGGNDIPYAYWSRGWAYYLSKQYQLAMNDYDRAISINPRAPEFYNDRGLLWFALENNDRARQDYDQAILLKPDYALPYMNLGVSLLNQNRPNEALVALSTAIEHNNTLWWAYENRAFIYENRSEWRNMYNDANRLIELQPNYRMGYEYRGHAYLEVGQYQPAIADFTKAISIDPDAIYGRRMRGRAYYFLGQFDNAMTDYQAALRIDPKDSSTNAFITDLRRKQRGQ